MLVLRRTCGQSIVIGKNAEIIIKVLRDEEGTIVIGIDAPKKIPVDRLEVYQKRHKVLSALSQTPDQENDERSICLNKALGTAQICNPSTLKSI